jgi:hypothetical protein
MATLSSPALLTRMLAVGLRTLLIDEADRSLRPDKEGIADVLAVLNSGYKRGATRPVLVPAKGGAWEVREMPTYAPVALAGNTPNLPDDTRSRIIRVLLLPDLDGKAEESDWEAIEEQASDLAGRIIAWADQVRDLIKTCRPALPDGITGRFREKWAPLRRVAELAGDRWPETVNAMATADKEQVEMDRDDGMIRDRPAVLLLKDLLDIWPEYRDFVPTGELVTQLATQHPDSWGFENPYGKTITAQRLGRMLASNFKVNSARRPDGDRARGYHRIDIEAVAERLGLPDQTGRTGQPGQIGRHPAGSTASAGSSGFFATARPSRLPF